jgi:hypothetical protein
MTQLQPAMRVIAQGKQWHTEIPPESMPGSLSRGGYGMADQIYALILPVSPTAQMSTHIICPISDQYYFNQEAEIDALIAKAEALVAESDYIFGLELRLTMREALELAQAQNVEICEESQR